MRRAVPLAMFLLGCAYACAPAQPHQRSLANDGWGPSIDESEPAPARPVAPRALPIPVTLRTRWERADELASLQPIPGRSPSEHLDGRFDRSVLVDTAASAYATLTASTQLPPGALVVQRHHPRGAERVVAYFVMERQDEGWRFLVLDEKQRVAAKKNLRLCARCHADAPFDGLFGPTSAADDM